MKRHHCIWDSNTRPAEQPACFSRWRCFKRTVPVQMCRLHWPAVQTLMRWKGCCQTLSKKQLLRDQTWNCVLILWHWMKSGSKVINTCTIIYELDKRCKCIYYPQPHTFHRNAELNKCTVNCTNRDVFLVTVHAIRTMRVCGSSGMHALTILFDLLGFWDLIVWLKHWFSTCSSIWLLIQ